LEEAMKENKALWLKIAGGRLLTSNIDGSVRTEILTPEELWGHGFNLADFLAGLRIEVSSANVGVTIKWEWSLDKGVWKPGSTVITEKTAVGDYTGVHNTVAEQTPDVRLISETRAVTGSNQESARISCWSYYKYRS
jgi:hypothetical protein